MSFQLEKVFPTLSKTERGKPVVLGSDPKGIKYLYVNGTSVIIRDVNDPAENDVYTQHAVATTVAKYSPSGFYIASSDISGKVRIWDTTQKEHILKNEFQPFIGPVKDLSWTSDSQRIAVGGEGREKFGAVFNAETGASTGEVMGMSRSVNSIDFKSSRPFRMVTGGEDAATCFFEGPPFKFKSISNIHTNFVNSVRFSPNGEYYASGGADGKIFLYNGSTGDQLCELGAPGVAHKGGIYGLCFSPDSKQLVSVSGDKSVRVWSVDEPRQLVQEHQFDTSQVSNMQLGCLWVGSHIITVALSGAIYFFNPTDLSKPARTLLGHNKPITGLGYSRTASRLVTGASDGAVGLWDPSTGECSLVGGQGGHTNQVQSLAVEEDTLVTVGIDDRLIVSSMGKRVFGESVKLNSQPRAVSLAGGLVAVACLKEVILAQGARVVAQLPVTYEPEAIAISPDKNWIAVGSQDNQIHILAVTGGSSLKPTGGPTKLDGKVTCLAFSPDSQLLASGDTDRRVSVFKVAGDATLTPAHSEYWRFHSARVNCLAWSPSGARLASGGLDCSVIVWKVSEPKTRISITNAHPMSQLTGLVWTDENTLFSAGQDSNLRKWRIN